ncbi:tyrosine-type recombinase/integrase [Thalassospira sp. MBR-102]|uniref:tyrosine-type recombinase/integrase n=1 Tax=Thalassospira sp. MBR-102 TaxID=3156466 RepID=UPI0033947FD9
MSDEEVTKEMLFDLFRKNKRIIQSKKLGLMKKQEQLDKQTSQIADLEMEGIVKDRIIAKKAVSENNPLKEDSVNLFSKRFHEFMEEKKSEITPAFYNFHKLVLRFFIEICEDKNLIEYKRSDSNLYRNTILELPKYPANWKKYFATTKVSEVLEKNKKLKRDTVSKTTFNKKHLAVLVPFFKWGIKQGYVDFNIFDDMTSDLTTKEKHIKRKEKRPSFSIEELNTIFNSENFTNRHKDLVYYGPLILLFSGLRFGELGQLKLKDIVEHNGILHFDLTGNDKSLKTVSSYRLVPVHDELQKIGLLKYVEERLKQSKNPEEYLFDISYNEKTKTYDSRRILRLFESFKEQGTLRKNIVVHSFRHSFRNKLVESGVDSETISMAMGHEGNEKNLRMAKTYNDGLIKKIQSERVLTLKYEGLELSHLYV